MSHPPYRRFLIWNALGGTLWAFAFVILGYLAGSQYKRIEHYANYIGLALLAIIAVTVHLRHRRNSQPGEIAADSETEAQPTTTSTAVQTPMEKCTVS